MKKDNSVTCGRHRVIVQAVASEDSIGQQRGGPGQRDGGGGGVEGHRLHRACRCTHRQTDRRTCHCTSRWTPHTLGKVFKKILFGCPPPPFFYV